MFDKWLRRQPVESPEGVLRYEALVESGQISDAELVDRLGHEVARNYLNPGELAMIFDDLGAPEVAHHLRTNKFPKTTMKRHGDFGEIIAGALYRRVRHWCVPILKLRYKQTAEQAVQGTDVLAFRLRQSPPAVAVPEVKTRATRDRHVGTEAYDSLEKVLDRLDESINFVFARCMERGQGFLARRLAELLRHPNNRLVERHMVFIHDAAKWKDDIITSLAAVVTQPTELTVVKIDNLQAFIARVYRAAETNPTSDTRNKDAAA